MDTIKILKHSPELMTEASRVFFKIDEEGSSTFNVLVIKKLKSIREHEFYISNDRNLSFVWREPKQFRYWLKKAGLKEEGKRSWNRKHPACTWEGHGHKWRLNCYGLFEISCPNYDFDRWANSATGISREIGLLETEEQFLSAVKEMLSKAKAVVSED